MRRDVIEEHATPISISAWETEEFLCDLRLSSSTDALDVSEDARRELAGM